MRKYAIAQLRISDMEVFSMSKADKHKRKTLDSEQRTTLNLSVTVADKQFLKIYAAEQGITVAAVIHECIEEYLSKKK